MIKYILCLFFYAVVSVSAFAGTIDPKKNDQQYVTYGKKFVHIGKIYGKDQAGLKYYGSCIAYDSKIVLTAGHILHDANDAHILINSKTIKVKKWVVHHKFQYKVLGLYDIAICFLEEDIGLDWYPDLYEQKNELNQICSISGYGTYGTFITGPTKIDDLRRAGSNRVSIIENGVLVCDPSVDHTKTELEFFTAPGDSGGGLFIDKKIAGINSYTMKFNPSNKQFSCHTRISDHIHWIKEQKKLLESNQ